MYKIIFLDNQDSFTYNLVDELEALNFDVTVYRNTISADYIEQQIEQLKQDGFKPLLFLSPGPGKPSDSITMMTLLERLVGDIPIIGVCLGHQAISEHFGGDVILAGETVHGKSSDIELADHPVFAGFGSSMQVARYHSLAVSNLPSDIQVIANYNHLPMAVIAEDKQVVGFQFHPESILTTQGSTLLKQTINYLLAEQ